MYEFVTHLNLLSAKAINFIPNIFTSAGDYATREVKEIKKCWNKVTSLKVMLNRLC